MTTTFLYTLLDNITSISDVNGVMKLNSTTVGPNCMPLHEQENLQLYISRNQNLSAHHSHNQW